MCRQNQLKRRNRYWTLFCCCRHLAGTVKSTGVKSMFTVTKKKNLLLRYTLELVDAHDAMRHTLCRTLPILTLLILWILCFSFDYFGNSIDLKQWISNL